MDFKAEAQRARDRSQMHSVWPLFFLSPSHKFSDGANLGVLNVEFLHVEYLQEQIEPTPSWTAFWESPGFPPFPPSPLAFPSPFSSPVLDLRKPTWSGCQMSQQKSSLSLHVAQNVWHFQGRGIVA